MQFGDPRTFSIEAQLEPDLQAPSAVWGRICIWCDGTPIGDVAEQHCALYPSYQGFSELLTTLPSLWRTEFEGLDDTALWNVLDEKLYGFHGDVELDDDRSLEDTRQDWRVYSSHDFLTNWGESFDHGGKSFIFCTPSQQVLILNRHLPAEKGVRLTASLFHVVAAIRLFLRWFKTEAARLGHPVD